VLKVDALDEIAIGREMRQKRRELSQVVVQGAVAAEDAVEVELRREQVGVPVAARADALV
jgi:hypothetical protein